MNVVRVLNNNAIVSKNDKGEEVILLGSGIAFKKKVGDVVSNQSIEKIFTLTKRDERNRFYELVSDIPYIEIQTTEKIVDYIQKQLDVKLDDNIYLMLTDHIHYALQRDKAGQTIRNKLIWEIEHFYPREYKIGLQTVEIINELNHSNLLSAEAGFIAMHIVNAMSEGRCNEFENELSDIKSVLKIVKLHFNTSLDEASISYGRFVTHLRYFLKRMYSQTSLKKIEQNDELFSIVCKKYFNSYLCVEKIDKYFMKERNVEISDEEKMYLILHIERMIEKEK